MSTRQVVVVSGARTGIGDYGGALKDLPATQLGAIAIKEARKLGIPVVAVVDTNCDPADADFPFPATW